MSDETVTNVTAIFECKKQKILSSVDFGICRVFKGLYELPKSEAASMSENFGSVKKYFFDRPFFQKIFFFDQKKSKNRVEKKKFATFFFAS